jgi:PAS domain S-box-containing protein
MADGQNPVSAEEMVEQALAAGVSQRVGWFRFYFDDQRWEWSPQVERMHGYEPGTITPTTEVVLSHKHPDDRKKIAATLNEILTTHQAFSTRHRIIDVQGEVHQVVVVGAQLYDEQETVVGTHGFYVDLTTSSREHEERVSAAVADIAEKRAVIEQAKGMLMLIYGIDAASAFDLLRWRSQHTNVKLRALAEQILSDFLALDPERRPPRPIYDQLLITAHERISDQAVT